MRILVLTALFAAASVSTCATMPGDITAAEAGSNGDEQERFNWRGSKDEEKNIEVYQKREKRSQAGVPENALYEEECSACHFLYQPWLLPSESWKLVMGKAEDHFGEDLALEEEDLSEILAYLVENAAEKSRARNEWAGSVGKIVRSIHGDFPESIRAVPYIKRKHRKIRAVVFERPAIKSFSNCGACHRTAAKGDYDEDNVKIPKRDKKIKP